MSEVRHGKVQSNPRERRNYHQTGRVEIRASMRVGVRDFIFLSSLTLFCQGLATGAAALDSHPQPMSDPLIEIETQVTRWSSRCAEMEQARRTVAARECWWQAAKVINQFTVGSHPLVGEVKRLRIDWLWRAIQLVLVEATKSGQQEEMEPHFSGGHDPARIVGPPACSSIAASDYKQCLGTTTGAGFVIAHPGSKTAPTYNSAVINEKDVKLRVSKKTKLDTTRPKLRRKKVKARHKEVALPIVQKVVRKRNFARAYGWKSRNAVDTPRDCCAD
jgi:hypothetical protein